LIISPSLLLLFDFDLLLNPSFNIYCLGYSWAFSFSFISTAFSLLVPFTGLGSSSFNIDSLLFTDSEFKLINHVGVDSIAYFRRP
jgi:hypothetical protein